MGDDLNGAFPSTHWSQVASAGGQDPAARQEALRQLLRRYIWPMQLHLRVRQKLDADAAEELVQQFLLSKVLAGNLMMQADSAKGRFRTFLLTALDRFVTNAARDQRARTPASLDDVPEPVSEAPAAPDAFDAAWAREVLAEALQRMRDACQERGREDIWSVFEARLIGPTLEQVPPVPYEQLVVRLRLSSASEGSNLLVTAKRAFARALRAVVGEYEHGEEQIEAEIASLQAALSRRGP